MSAGVLAAGVWLLNLLADALIPFVVALVLAYLLNPLTEVIERRIGNRATAVVAALTLVGAAIWLALWLLTPVITGEIRHMARLVAEMADGSTLDHKALQSLPPELWQAVKDTLAQQNVRDILASPDVLSLARTVLSKLLPGMWGIMQGAANALFGVVGLFVILLYLVFLLIDYRRVREGWTQVIPPARREGVTAFIDEFSTAMSRYFRAQAAVAGLVGVLFAIGFGLIGLPLGILLGLFIGLLNMVPYLQIVGFIPALALGIVHALETGTPIWTETALILTVFAVVQIIQDAVLTPRIMGKVTGLSPAFILLSLSIWGQLLGMLGLLMAIPCTCLLWAYWQRYLGTLTPAAAPAPPDSDA
nr:AI-2E family transporter [Desulfobaculum xiamenense]